MEEDISEEWIVNKMTKGQSENQKEQTGDSNPYFWSFAIKKTIWKISSAKA